MDMDFKTFVENWKPDEFDENFMEKIVEAATKKVDDRRKDIISELKLERMLIFVRDVSTHETQKGVDEEYIRAVEIMLKISELINEILKEERIENE